MKTAKAVLGAWLGDEGKGLVTDYLCSQAEGDALVVRFNGGAQAGHTVVRPQDRRRHVFHHIGSGTFALADTFLSRFFLSNPVLFLQEAAELDLSLSQCRVFVDAASRVTTPYDMLLNQIAEDARGKGRHGSCGVGIRETVVRSEHPEYAITVGMLEKGPALWSRLWDIQKAWVPQRLGELGNPPVSDEMAHHLETVDTLERFLNDCERFTESVRVMDGPEILRQYPDVVFEGAQGLLLDQDHAWFPHVTSSHTGLRNVQTLCCEAGIERVEVTYVTRGYVTRHGAGPFPFDPLEYPIRDLTNVDHPYQGRLRTGVLDAGILRKSIEEDLATPRAIGLAVEPGLAVTCLDHMMRNVVKLRDLRLCFDERHFMVDWIEEATGFPVRLVSQGPSRTHVKRR